MTTEEDPIPLPVRWAKLTKREQTVARHLRDGLTYKETATALGIKYNTVNTHTKAIYRKFGVRSRAMLVALLIQLRPPEREGENVHPP